MITIAGKKIKKKTAVIGSLAILAALTTVTLFILAKNGKLGNKCKNFVNNIFKPKNTPTNKPNPAVTNTPPTGASSTTGDIQKYIPPEIAPEKILEDGTIINKSLQVQHNTNSVADDIADWARAREKAGKTLNNSDVTINHEFNGFEIKPHTYTDDTSIYIHSRDHGTDFVTYKIEDGVMKKNQNKQL